MGLMDEVKEIARFGFGIKLFSYPDGKLRWQIQNANDGVPNEIVIMNMKAFLQKLEKDYFDRYNSAVNAQNK